ncbi:MAG: c-type cytochrome [Minwuiales bacterium]|nr:c-type cytochrome [Minwuiales bacterium]
MLVGIAATRAASPQDGTPSQTASSKSTYQVAAISGSAPSEAAPPDDMRSLYRRPTSIPFPKNAPYSPQLATLGKMLFFDPRLSGAKNMNCASCHNPSFGYEAPVERAVGSLNEPLSRHAPTTLNMAWVEPLMWDGRAASLEEQAAGPITAPAEMNARFDDIIATLTGIAEYATWFDSLFPGQGITRESILTAIATYERTIVSGWSAFDRWVDGNDAAMSEAAINGFRLFNGKANCAACHTGWNFTDNQFHDIGLYTDDIGRAAIDPSAPDKRHAFKTPGLRDLSYRAPFMHNGSIPDLEMVIQHYESGGMRRPSLSPLMVPFRLTDEEREDLLAFLMALTADVSDTPMPNLPN